MNHVYYIMIINVTIIIYIINYKDIWGEINHF